MFANRANPARTVTVRDTPPGASMRNACSLASRAAVGGSTAHRTSRAATPATRAALARTSQAARAGRRTATAALSRRTERKPMASGSQRDNPR